MKHLLLLLLIGIILPVYTQVNELDANGKKHGKWVETWPQSTIKKWEGTFEHGTPVGKFKFWYESGKARCLMQYSDNGKTTRATYFHENGNLMAQGKYINKEKDSTWLLYDAQERLSTSEYYVNGKLEGKRTVYYVATEMNNSSSTFKEGRPFKVENYRNGLLHGEYREYYPDGKKKVVGQYVDGNKEGSWNIYYPNGKFEKVENYKYAVKHGVFIVFDQNGNVEGKLFYRHGRLLEGKELERYLENAPK